MASSGANRSACEYHLKQCWLTTSQWLGLDLVVDQCTVFGDSSQLQECLLVPEVAAVNQFNFDHYWVHRMLDELNEEGVLRQRIWPWLQLICKDRASNTHGLERACGGAADSADTKLLPFSEVEVERKQRNPGC